MIPAGIGGTLAIRSLEQIATPLSQQIPNTITALSKATELNSLAQQIHYYDEVLTQSARNYAFTGNVHWKTRYETSAPILDSAIKKAIALGDRIDNDFFKNVDTANIALVQMEETSMRFVDDKQNSKAIAILEGTTYAEQKTIYKNGLDNYVSRHESLAEETNAASLSTLKAITDKVQLQTENGKSLIAIIIVISSLLFLLWGVVLAFLLTKPLKDLEKTALLIASGKDDERSNIKSKNEIGNVARAINQMADNLQKSKAGIEIRVKERTLELEKLNKFMVGRELKMMELKKELEDLKKA